MKLSGSLLVLTLLFLGSPLLAQNEDDDEGRVSLGIGAGMADGGLSTEPYLNANVRFRVGYRPEGSERESGIIGFVEPEAGYWTGDVATGEWSDTLVGVNLGGAVRLRVFEYFLAAGAGYHFLDGEQRLSNGTVRDFDEGAFGMNVHFGFDIRFSQSVSVYGVGRFDLIDVEEVAADLIGNEQTKAYLGVRFRL